MVAATGRGECKWLRHAEVTHLRAGPAIVAILVRGVAARVKARAGRSCRRRWRWRRQRRRRRHIARAVGTEHVEIGCTASRNGDGGEAGLQRAHFDSDR